VISGLERRTATLVAALAFGSYFTVARIVGNVYPFSIFPMYAGQHRTTGSRIVVKDESQALHEVSDGLAWTCDDAAEAGVPPGGAPSPALDAYACTGSDVYSITYVDREAIEYIRTHPGSDPRAQPVELVRHIWSFPDERNPPTTHDCHVAFCRVVLRR